MVYMGLEEELRKEQIKYLENRICVYSKLEYVSVLPFLKLESTLPCYNLHIPSKV
jgi:hypothetical protein